MQCGRGDAGVYVYDSWTKTSRTPSKGELSWDIECIRRFHKKHVLFCMRRCPCLEQISASLLDTRNKIAWRILFKSRNSEPGEWRQVYVKPARTTHYPLELDASTSGFIDDMYTSLGKAMIVARSKFGPSPRLPLVILGALRKLKRGMWGRLPADKAGGFCLLRKARLADMYGEALGGHEYISTSSGF